GPRTGHGVRPGGAGVRAGPGPGGRSRAGRAPRRRRGLGTTARSSALAPPGPGPGVGPVVDGLASLAQVQRTEGVDHDGQLVEGLRPDTALVGAWLGAVGVPARVQGDRTLADTRPL